MIFSSKHFEDLEGAADVVQEFETERSETTEEVDESTDSALAWRRGMIERAVANVKKALQRASDSDAKLAKGSLFFDAGKKRFARVLESGQNGLRIGYLTGDLALVNVAPKKAKSQSAEPPEPKASKKETGDSLKKVKSLMANEAPKKASMPVKQKSIVKAPAAKLEKKKASVTKAVAPKKKPKKAAIGVRVGMPKNASDPVADPNSYIRRHFQLMNNKELASVTGLSEHTIRRKLGEWGLKRAKA